LGSSYRKVVRHYVGLVEIASCSISTITKRIGLSLWTFASRVHSSAAHSACLRWHRHLGLDPKTLETRRTTPCFIRVLVTIDAEMLGLGLPMQRTFVLNRSHRLPLLAYEFVANLFGAGPVVTLDLDHVLGACPVGCRCVLCVCQDWSRRRRLFQGCRELRLNLCLFAARSRPAGP